jgi:phospholipid/cholesterol/gamma-HCH transport system permease protein
MNLFQPLGAAVIDFVRNCGKIGLFFLSIIKPFKAGKVYWRKLFQQLLEIGYYSLPVVGLTAIFTGAVLALQSYTGFSRFNAESSIASVVALSIIRELGPVLAGLMLSGRVAASIAAEIGSMKVTDQIDALYTLNTNPINYLVVPRVVAGVIALPLLVIIADIIGVFGGYLVAVYKLNFSPYSYLNSTINYIHWADVQSSLIKALVFGFIVTFIGCFYGFNSKGGAQGVGYATTTAVVVSSIMILLANYIITGILF